jgi:hypothetical protein
VSWWRWRLGRRRTPVLSLGRAECPRGPGCAGRRGRERYRYRIARGLQSPPSSQPVRRSRRAVSVRRVVSVEASGARIWLQAPPPAAQRGGAVADRRRAVWCGGAVADRRRAGWCGGAVADRRWVGLTGSARVPGERRRDPVVPAARCAMRRRPRSRRHPPLAATRPRRSRSTPRLPLSPDGSEQAPPAGRSTRAGDAPHSLPGQRTLRRLSFPNHPFSRGLQTFPRAPEAFTSPGGGSIPSELVPVCLN